MYFDMTVEGPQSLGDTMTAFVEVYDQNNALFNPPNVRAHVQTGANDHCGFLYPGDKLTNPNQASPVGLCEFAPLQGVTAKYLFRMESVIDDEVTACSEWITCDLGLPFIEGADATTGQLHKNFFVRAHQTVQPDPPPTDPCERCTRFEEARAGVTTALSALNDSVAELNEV